MAKILIVDDEDIIRRALARIFTSEKHQVIEAADGEQAIAQWREVQPDLVFLDVLMPGRTGVQVLEEMEGNIHCKVVLMSAYTGEYNLETAKALGAQYFIPKPFDDIQSLKSLVEEILDGE
ncbi:MAG: response regulator [Bdellovibrionaceae bacterium]|nr:response regulator [Pseudobdellovibrionaceae bacterium]